MTASATHAHTYTHEKQRQANLTQIVRAIQQNEITTALPFPTAAITNIRKLYQFNITASQPSVRLVTRARIARFIRSPTPTPRKPKALAEKGYLSSTMATAMKLCWLIDEKKSKRAILCRRMKKKLYVCVCCCCVDYAVFLSHTSLHSSHKH